MRERFIYNVAWKTIPSIVKNSIMSPHNRHPLDLHSFLSAFDQKQFIDQVIGQISNHSFK
jgi:hypothetical protein